MSATPHDSDNDRLTEGRKLSRKTGQSRARAQAESNVTVSTNTLKKYGEDSERVVLPVHDFLFLGGNDAEGSEEDVPQVEAQLVADMLHHV